VLEFYKKKTIYIFGCGLLAGGLASCITQPFDVIKTNQQILKEKISFIDVIVLIRQVYNIISYLHRVITKSGNTITMYRLNILSSVFLAK